MAGVQLPDSASLERTQGRTGEDRRDRPQRQGVAHVLTVAGFSFVQGANGSNFGSMFITLDPFSERKRSGADRRGNHGQIAAAMGPAGQGRAGARLRRAADPRAERGRRVQAHGRGSRRTGLVGSGPTDRRTGRQAAKGAGIWRAYPRSFAPRRRNSTWTSTGPRSRRWEYR